MWVVVIKKMGSADRPVILRRTNLRSVCEWINKQERKRRMIDWSEPMLDQIRNEYGRTSSAILATRLARQSGEPVTKNAVVSKAQALGLGRRRARPNIEGGF